MSFTDRRLGVSGYAAFKLPVVAATTELLEALAGLLEIDGVQLVEDDRVLVKDQDNPVDNGIYVATTSTWSRAVDFDGPRDAVEGSLVLVTRGDENRNVVYMQTTANPIVGTTALTFSGSFPAPLLTGAATIDVGWAIGGSDTEDFVPKVQALYDSGEVEGKHLVYGAWRQWVSPAKPTTGLGPQSQYLTPPRTTTHEWATGATWDFSAYTQSGSPVYMRRDGRYGDSYAVVGSLTKGASTIPLAAGAGAALTALGVKFGSWLALHNTARQTDLVGAFTLADAYNTGFAARTNNLWVKEIIGDTLYLLNSLDDDYDSSAVPVVKMILDSPDIRLINPSAIGPGVGLSGNDDRFFQIVLGRIRIEGGQIENFAQSVRVFSCPNGYIRDLTMYGTKQVAPGGGMTVGDATQDFLVDNCTSYGGSQMFMQSGSGSWYGVTRSLRFRGCKAYYPFNGFSTHNICEDINYESCEVYGARSYSFDLRCPNITSVDCIARDGQADAIIFRIAPRGLQIDNFLADNCRSGAILEDDFNPPFEPVSVGDITITNSSFLNIGALGSSRGAMRFLYSEPTFPVLGIPTLTGNTLSMQSNATAFRLQGQWTDARIADNDIRAGDDFTPTGLAYRISAPEANPSTTDGGPINLTFVRNAQAASYRDPFLQLLTGLTTYANNTIYGDTGTGVRALTEDTVLRLVQTNTTFTNEGAAGAVDVEMPFADGRNFAAKFDVYVQAAQVFNWKSVGLNKIVVSGGAPGLNIKSSTINDRMHLTAINQTTWVAEETGSWTQDWSPYSLLTDMVVWFDQAPAYISEKEDEDAGVDIITRWVDINGSGVIMRGTTTDGPVKGEEWFDFAGNKYMEPTALLGAFPSGANAGSTWLIVKQTALPADTSTRTILAWGDTANTSRALVRVVSGGVNRFAVQIGTGASVTTVTEGTVDFSGWHWVRLKYDGSDATAIIDGTASTPVTVAASTTATRLRVGAAALTTASSFFGGKMNDIFGTVDVPTDESDLEAWLDDRVAMLNTLDP